MKNQINKAVQCLKEGGVIIYPSESCYSFGCDAENKQAVERIHEIKKEPKEKPITLIVSDLKQINEFGLLEEVSLKLCKKFLPGQLNLIIEKRNDKEYPFLSKDGISFRIPKSSIAFELAKRFGSAITTTSVNIHKDPPLYKISEIRRCFQDKVDFIIDMGNLDEKIPQSTVYDARKKEIVRNGPIAKDEINSAF